MMPKLMMMLTSLYHSITASTVSSFCFSSFTLGRLFVSLTLLSSFKSRPACLPKHLSSVSQGVQESDLDHFPI